MRNTVRLQMEKLNIGQEVLAKEIDASAGVVNKFLKGKEIRFDIVWKILKHLSIENRNDFLSEYIDELTTKKNIKYAIEYFCLHGLDVQFNKLIEKANKGDSELKEWARVYSALREFQKTLYKSNDHQNVLKHLRRLDTPYKETKLAIFVYEMYTIYYINELKLLYQYLLGLNKDVLTIDDEFLRICYSSRIDEVMCHIELRYKNNPEGARIYCDRVLDIDVSEHFNSTANFIKGMSYLFEDYDKCIYYYEKCLEFYKKINRKVVIDDVKQEIDFVHLVWDKDIEYSSEFTQLLYDVKKGIKNPDKLDSYMSEEREPWIYLVKGIALNDNLMLFSSFMKFRKKDDFFLANIPKNEMVKRGSKEEFFNNL